MARVLPVALMVCCGCAPVGSPELVLSSDKSTFDGRFERAILQVSGLDATGEAGTGTVVMTVGVGVLVEGDEVPLIDGVGTATFRCVPSSEPACAGPVRIGATWKGVSRAITVRVTPSDPSARPKWAVVPTLQPVELHAAALAPDRTVWAVGDKGTVIPFRNGAWGPPAATGVTSALRALFISSDGSLDIVGDDDVVLTGPPAALTRLRTGTPGTAYSAVARYFGSLVVTTRAGQAGVWDGATFFLEQVSPGPLNSLALGPTGLLAAGDDGLVQFNGGSWTAVVPPVLARWRQARIDTDGLWLLGARFPVNGSSSQPVLVQGPGPDWKSASLPTGNVKAMEWGLGSAERYVVTDTSVFRKQDGTAWEDLEAPSGGNAAVVLGSVSVLVVGPPGVSLLRVR